MKAQRLASDKSKDSRQIKVLQILIIVSVGGATAVCTPGWFSGSVNFLRSSYKGYYGVLIMPTITVQIRGFAPDICPEPDGQAAACNTAY